MRQESIKYPQDLPLTVSVVEIENYPLHWHDALEIIYVLSGQVTIEIGEGSYEIGPGEIEIINPNEVHSIQNKTKGQRTEQGAEQGTAQENLLLMFHIDPEFFEEYYKGAKDVFFYADSSKRSIQQSPRYDTLRRYLAVLYYEVLAHHENYKDEIDHRLLSLMYYLLNNFHYLYYEEESLREDDLELERYHRIVRYISNNYMEKVSLQEIAEQEFLTAQYLSFKIKNTFGYGFNDFLNLTRVKESLKLLLNTDLNISEIAHEIGYSHVRYYNKHFKHYYHMTPMEYRRKYQVSDQQLEAQTKISQQPLNSGVSLLEPYLETYERYQYDDRIHRFEIDLSGESVGTLAYSKILHLGRGEEIYNFRNDDSLEEKIRNLGFEYALVDDLDSIFGATEDPNAVNWHLIDSIIDYILALGLEPIFLTNGKQEFLESLLEYLRQHRQDIDSDQVHFLREKEFFKQRKRLFTGTDPRNDTLYRVGDVIVKNQEPIERIATMRDVNQTTIGESDTFYGGEGLVTFNGLQKPSYYAYLFLAQMGEEIIYSEEGLLVTRSEQGFEVLLYDPLEGEEKKSHIGQRKRYSLNLVNMDTEYRVTRHEIDKDSGSVYDKWRHLGSPRILSYEYTTLLEASTVPEIKFYHAPVSTVYNIFATIQDRGAMLYLFREV